MKPTKLKRHQETKHLNTVGESQELFQGKKTLAQSKRSTDIRKAFEKVGSESQRPQRAREASFECSLLIGKAKKLQKNAEQPIKPVCCLTVASGQSENRPTFRQHGQIIRQIKWLDIASTGCTRNRTKLILPFSWMKRQPYQGSPCS